MHRKRRLVWSALGLAVAAAAAGWVAWLYQTTPAGNAGAGPVDALLVLGSPTELDGSLTTMQRWRVEEAVREYRAGVAEHIVFTGGRTPYYVESQSMGAYALRLGVPETAVFEETRSLTTQENLDNTRIFLKQRRWYRVEVISSEAHLHRAAVLIKGSGLAWRLHAAPTPGMSRFDRCRSAVENAVGTAVLRVFGVRAEPVLHGIAKVLQAIGFGFRWVGLKLHGR